MTPDIEQIVMHGHVEIFTVSSIVSSSGVNGVFSICGYVTFPVIMSEQFIGIPVGSQTKCNSSYKSEYNDTE